MARSPQPSVSTDRDDTPVWNRQSFLLNKTQKRFANGVSGGNSIRPPLASQFTAARVSRGYLNIRVESALSDNGCVEVSENAISSARTKFAGRAVLSFRHRRS